jgi:RES domain-containing protein
VFIPTIDLAQRDTVRLVSSGRLKAPVLSPLADDPAALADLVRLEGATSGRLRTQQAGLEGLSSRELVFGRTGWTFINAAFSYTRDGGNRFNDGSRGAWYAGFTAETALAEVSFHLGRELAAVGRFDNTTDYAELLADFIGPFHDIRQSPPDSPCLHPEPEVGYPAGQALARDLAGRSSNGIVYPSVRHPGGTCLVAFRPDLVQNVRQGDLWRLQWQGSLEPTITAVAVEAG